MQNHKAEFHVLEIFGSPLFYYYNLLLEVLYFTKITEKKKSGIVSYIFHKKLVTERKKFPKNYD